MRATSPRWPVAVVAVVAVSPLAAYAEAAPLGVWACIRALPEGPATLGTVEVFEQGEAFRVVWRMGAHTWEGTGVMQSGYFAVAFVDHTKNLYGIVLLKRDADRWVGHWSGSGNPLVWDEIWTRPPSP